MKKFLTLFLVMVLGLALAACGDDKKDDGDKDKADVTTGEKEDGATDATEGASEDAPEFTDEFYKQVYDTLKDKGYELEVVGKEEDNIMLGVTDNTRIMINQEDFLPLQIFTIEPGTEFLAEAKETGEWPLEYEGERGMVPVVLIGEDHFVFFGEGHPNYADVIAALEELK
ncbi:hypothetical protein H9649_06500 [Sporosarcina sp. Sa2YVA2]|uniref:Lipoprotein n=1 Tax=Sporosarcina quadrami TaxID=2762234 RepID=A0ABR8U863_9BACL|nr:hypothetical protein [Sporosarcina quadrami]MBD7984222.1 hypothetical protein [Sporosarcina quadrami]